MTNECCACNASVLVTQKRIKCVKCQAQYHLECITSFGNKPIVTRGQWICPNCHNNNRNNINKAPSPPLANTSKDNFDNHSDWLAAIRNEVKEVLSQTVSLELKSIREELTGLQSIKQSLEYLSSHFDSIKQELEEAKKEITSLKKDNYDLRQVLNSQNNTINNLEREIRATNLELHCVPEHRSENLVTTIEQIGRVINVPLTEGAISKCTRIAKINKETSRPRSVLVKFSNPLLRDSFLAGVIKFNKSNPDSKLNTSHLGISGDKKPVYISEHLTSTAKDIYAATRIFAKEKQYRFVWSRNGNIYLRKSISSDVILVKSKEFLKTLQ
ncbi:unnamed protein product, partial [Brenthis ino]